MLATIFSIPTLLLGVGLLLTGNGFLSSLLGVRAGAAQIPESVIGLIMSAYFIGFVLGSFYCPLLIRRVGHIRAFAAMAAVASAAAIAHGLVFDPLVWGALRVLTGICLVGLYMVIESWLNVLAPSHRRTRFFATYMTVTLLALGAGQLLLLVNGADGFVPFMVVSIFFSLGLVPIALTKVAEPKPMQIPKMSLPRLFRASPLGVIGAAAAGLTSGAFWGVGVLFAQGIGLDKSGITAFMSATVFGGVALQWPIGHLSDLWERRRVLTVVSFAGAAAAIAVLVFGAVSPFALMASAFLYGGIAFSVYGLSAAHVNDHLPPEDMLESARGLLLVNGIGAVFGPVAAGLVMDGVGPKGLPLVFAAAFVLLGVSGLARMVRREPVTVAEQTPFVPMTRTSPAALEMHPQAELESELDLQGTQPQR